MTPMPLLPPIAIKHFQQTTPGTAGLQGGLEINGFIVSASPAACLTGNLKNILPPIFDDIMDLFYWILIKKSKINSLAVVLFFTK